MYYVGNYVLAVFLHFILDFAEGFSTVFTTNHSKKRIALTESTFCFFILLFVDFQLNKEGG